MVSRFIAQVLTFLKKILADGVKTYVIEIFTQSAQLSQSQEFGFAQIS